MEGVLVIRIKLQRKHITMDGESPHEREFVFTDEDFHYVQRLLYSRTGIAVADVKKNMVYSRLARRLRQLNFDKFSEYFSFLERNESNEMQNYFNALTTNLTAFFREQHHFDYLASTYLPDLIKQKDERSIKIWSAGCSTGEEPYSLAMILSEFVPDTWDKNILATDLDTNVLETAANGCYPYVRIEDIDQTYKKRYMLKGAGEKTGMVMMRSKIRQMTSFKQLNLIDEWPMRKKFDAIFCRNVIIYFDKDTQRKLIKRYADILHEGGLLFLGHSESLYKVSDRFSLLGKTIYKKVK